MPYGYECCSLRILLSNARKPAETRVIFEPNSGEERFRAWVVKKRNNKKPLMMTFNCASKNLLKLDYHTEIERLIRINSLFLKKRIYVAKIIISI